MLHIHHCWPMSPLALSFNPVGDTFKEVRIHALMCLWFLQNLAQCYVMRSSTQHRLVTELTQTPDKPWTPYCLRLCLSVPLSVYSMLHSRLLGRWGLTSLLLLPSLLAATFSPLYLLILFSLKIFLLSTWEMGPVLLLQGCPSLHRHQALLLSASIGGRKANFSVEAVLNV